MSLELSDLQNAVREDAAIRARATLQPMGGEGDKIFPPTHAVDENKLKREDSHGAKYAKEWRRIEGNEHHCVLLDSVQSQANRMEDALYRLWTSGQIVLPVVTVNFGEEFPDLAGINSLTAPHRVADALLRDSYLGSTLFRHSDLRRSFVGASIGNVQDLFRVCPTALVFGMWDSTGPTGTGLRLARNLTSEIVGMDAIFGVKSGSRIDPAGIVDTTKSGLFVYKADPARAPLEQWTTDRDLAQMEKDEPVKYGKDKKKAGKTSSINHSNFPPTMDLLAGGVTISHGEQTVVLSLAGIRRLGFGTPEESEAARTVLAALGLIAVLAAADDGYFLRSRCHLSPMPGKALTFQRVSKDGTGNGLTLTLGDAVDLYRAAVGALPENLRWHPWDLERASWSVNLLTPSMPIATLNAAPKLQQLVRVSRQLGAAGEAEDQGAETGNQAGG